MDDIATVSLRCQAAHQDGAPRIAANITKLPGLLRPKDDGT